MVLGFGLWGSCMGLGLTRVSDYTKLQGSGFRFLSPLLQVATQDQKSKWGEAVNGEF